MLCVYNAYLILAFLAAFLGEYVHNMVRRFVFDTCLSFSGVQLA